MVKLSPTAWEILLALDEPEDDTLKFNVNHKFVQRLQRFVDIESGIAKKSIKSLEKKGLIKNNQTTEDGRLAIEQALEKNAIPLELPEQQLLSLRKFLGQIQFPVVTIKASGNIHTLVLKKQETSDFIRNSDVMELQGTVKDKTWHSKDQTMTAESNPELWIKQ